jgi:hypothetical protein
MTIIAPVVPSLPVFPGHGSPYTNITPYTYRSAETHIEYIESLRIYMMDVIAPFIGNVREEVIATFIERVTQVITDTNTALGAQATSINEALTNQQTAVANFLATQSAENAADLLANRQYVDAAVQSIINATIAVTDPVLMGIVGNPVAQFSQYLKNTFVEQNDLRLNVRDFGAKGDGVTNDYAAIKAAWEFGGNVVNRRSLYFPKGVYVFDGPPLGDTPIVGTRNPSFVGEDKANTTIKLDGAATWLYSENTNTWQTFLAENITFDANNKPGIFRNTRAVVNVTQTKIINNCTFLNYSVCAVSSDAPDEPYWNITRCQFNAGALNNMTAIGICLMGSADGGNISGNVFIRGRIQLKLGRAATVKVHDNDFVPYTPGDGTAARANIWLVCGASTPPGAVIDSNKFGNEGITATDYHIIVAEELPGTFGGDKYPNLAADSVNTLQGLVVSHNVFAGATAPANPALIYSTTALLTECLLEGNQTVGSSPGYMVEFRTPSGPNRLNQGNVIAHPVGGGGTETFGPQISNSIGWATVQDSRGTTSDPVLPHHYAGGSDHTAYLNLLATKTSGFTLTNATKAAITDAVGGTDAFEITYAGAGNFYGGLTAAPFKIGVPVFLEFDIAAGSVNPITELDFSIREGSTGIYHFRRRLRVPAASAGWRRKRVMWIPRAAVVDPARFQLLAIAAGTVKLGRAAAYHGDEPVNHELIIQNTTVTAGTPSNGGAGALPTPAGYITAYVNGAPYKIPIFNNV